MHDRLCSLYSQYSRSIHASAPPRRVGSVARGPLSSALCIALCAVSLYSASRQAKFIRRDSPLTAALSLSLVTTLAIRESARSGRYDMIRVLCAADAKTSHGRRPHWRGSAIF